MNIKVISYWFLLFGCIGIFIFYSLLVNGSDRYDPLLEKELELEKFTTLHQYEYEHIYDGNHAIVLASEDPVEIGEDYNTAGLELKVELTSKSGKKIDQLVDGHLYPFWGDKYSGIGLIRYVVPSDMPKNELMKIKIEFSQESINILKKYKFTKLLILKLSDQ